MKSKFLDLFKGNDGLVDVLGNPFCLAELLGHAAGHRPHNLAQFTHITLVMKKHYGHHTIVLSEHSVIDFGDFDDIEIIGVGSGRVMTAEEMARKLLGEELLRREPAANESERLRDDDPRKMWFKTWRVWSLLLGQLPTAVAEVNYWYHLRPV